MKKSILIIAIMMLVMATSALALTTHITNSNITVDKIGIGTASADYPLTFATALGSKISLYQGSNYGFGLQSSIFQFIIPANTANFVFGYGTSSSLTELVRIQGDGKVGIGTSSPSQKLTVAGNVNISGASKLYSPEICLNGDCRTAWPACCSSGNSTFTSDGGLAIKVIAGQALSAGEVVYINQTGSNGRVYKNPVNSDMPIGVVYVAASAGSEVLIVVDGIAKVLPESGITAARGYVIYSSGSQAGRVAQRSDVPSATEHWKEIGHFLDAGTGNGALTRAIVHFN